MAGCWSLRALLRGLHLMSAQPYLLCEVCTVQIGRYLPLTQQQPQPVASLPNHQLLSVVEL